MAFSSGNSGGPMADINVTPLVDVMLVLLIIFIVTAPIMTYPIAVDVKEDGSIYWNDEEIDKQTLESRLATAAQQTPQPPLNLRGDRTTKMRVINEMTKVAQEQGMLDVGFVATKEKGQ